MREIGQRHGTLCQYIARYTQTQGWPPSRREIKQALGFTSTSHVAYYLETLEQQGYLHCQPHISRGMLLTPAGYALAQQGQDRADVACPSVAHTSSRDPRQGVGHRDHFEASIRQ